jgi:hypothetical protein
MPKLEKLSDSCEKNIKLILSNKEIIVLLQTL